jgi:hypothetical protein
MIGWACSSVERNSYENLLGKYLGKLPRGRTKGRYQDNIKLQMKNMHFEYLIGFILLRVWSNSEFWFSGLETHNYNNRQMFVLFY